MGEGDIVDFMKCAASTGNDPEEKTSERTPMSSGYLMNISLQIYLTLALPSFAHRSEKSQPETTAPICDRAINNRLFGNFRQCDVTSRSLCTLASYETTETVVCTGFFSSRDI